MADTPEKRRERDRRYRERSRERTLEQRREKCRRYRERQRQKREEERAKNPPVVIEKTDVETREKKLGPSRRYRERNRELLNKKRTERRRKQRAEAGEGRAPKLSPEERRQRNIESARRSNARVTAEDRARINEKRRKRRAEGKMPPSERWKLTPEGRAVINAATRARRAAARAARPRPVYSSPLSCTATPSFPECAAPSPHRDMLLDISSRVARSDDRDDIIGQAVLNVLEGMDIDEAVIRARRTVRAGTSHLRYSIPFHDCHFL